MSERAERRPPIRLKKTVSVGVRVRARGQVRRLHEDFYHSLLEASWSRFFVVIALLFAGINALFGTVYMLDAGAIANTRPGSFEDAFFFSVQTFATIGYGGMMPVTLFGHVVVTCEALTGMLSVALMTGIAFAKFSRPTARVLFADKAVVTRRNGVPHLQFRMANWRHNLVVEAQLRVMLLLPERTDEGDVVWRPHELPLVRDRTPMFLLSWTAMHRIDETSHFHGPGAIDRLRALRCEIIVMLSGLDETTGQTIHARCIYSLDDIVPDARFADVVTILPDGTREIDYTRFHDVEPVPAADVTASPSP